MKKIEGKVKKKNSEYETEYSEEMNRNFRLLLILIAILLISDIFFIYMIYKPDLSGLFSLKKDNNNDTFVNDSVKRCYDGTKFGECSKNKPYICYEGYLIKSAYFCGCPEGYRVDFQDCVEI